MDILEEKGAGAIIEINFQPQDYNAVLREMKARNIPMLNMDGSPLSDDGGLIKEGVVTGDDIEHTSQRIAYWPTDLTRGTSVEIFEVKPGDEGGLINIRDKMWEDEPAASPDQPWIDHIAIWVTDLKVTASFYTDVLGLERYHKEIDTSADNENEKIGAFKACFIDAKGIWLELVQPVGPGALTDTLQEKGDGYLGRAVHLRKRSGCLQRNDAAQEYTDAQHRRLSAGREELHARAVRREDGLFPGGSDLRFGRRSGAAGS